MELPEKIKALRAQRHMTQEELAQKLFVSRTNVSKWETGNGYPGMDALKSLSSLFDVSISDLVSSDELIILAKDDNQKHLKAVYRIIQYCVLAVSLIAVLTCFIVDLCVSKGLTWSLIVDMSILYACAVIYTVLYSKTYRIAKGMAVFSLLLLPLLWGYERAVNTFFLPEPIHWFVPLALPISLIWLAILWAAAAIRAVTRKNYWFVLGVLLLLSVFGSAFTNLLAQQRPLREIFLSNGEWINTVAYLACAAACFVVYRSRKDKANF